MGVSSSEPSQQSSPCTDSLFLLALLPLLLLSLIHKWHMLTVLLMAMDMLALLPLTHMLPMVLLPLWLMPMLPPSLLLMPVLDSQKPALMSFPQSDLWLRHPLLSTLSSPSSSGDTRLLTKQQTLHRRKKENSKKRTSGTNQQELVTINRNNITKN